MNTPPAAPPAARHPDRNAMRVADFFSGCGGTSAGLRAAGMTIALGLDNDPEASKTYRMNFPEAVHIERDIRDVDPAEIVTAAGAGAGPLLVSACAPCQPYSTFAKRGRQTDDRRTLLLRLVPVLDVLAPDYVLVENVPGLRAPHSRAGTFNRFRKALRDRGYDTADGIVDCRDYGVPQRRRRLILIASAHGPVDLPAPTHGSAAGTPHSTVREWIANLPPIAAGETHPTVANHRASNLTARNLERLRATPEGGDRADWPDNLLLDCHRGHDGHSDVYGRLCWDGQAPVLTTKCTSISNGRFGHPAQDRPISVREAASLQTFPPTFGFVGGIKSETRQVGNAVPVLLAQRIGEHILDHWAAATSTTTVTAS